MAKGRHYRDSAIVLRTYKLHEADRIVVLGTAAHGKVRAVAKGVRRTKSRIGARLEPASLVQMQCYTGRELDIVTQVESENLHPSLRFDVDRFARASVLLEICDQLFQPGEANLELFNLLKGALAELDRTGNPVIVPAFTMKALVLEGVQPSLDRCAECGTTENLSHIAVHEGGVLCGNCQRGEPLSDAVRHVLAELSAGRVRSVLEHTPPAIADQVEHLSSRMMEQHIERRLRSATVLHAAADRLR